MKNKLHDDEYYTREISPSLPIMDSEDNLESENNDTFDLYGTPSHTLNQRDCFCFKFFFSLFQGFQIDY